MTTLPFEFYSESPQYRNVTFPEPRPFQDEAHEALRNGFRNGHKRQVLMAATGAGKTFIGLRLAHEALAKGRSALFICDRTTLIDQTSAVADRYGLSAHGVIQAKHWRTDPSMPFQIASVQTLANRTWPKADVVIIDEVHCQYKAWVDRIPNLDAAVIGLSATPFSSGLGRLFSNLVNAAPMARLVAEGHLVPMRVFSCIRADMTDAETRAGEWTDRAAEERGMAIIGDVVSEWQSRAEGRKTICFGATIHHCEEIARQFSEAGIMASVFSAKTPQSERETILKEYRKQDSLLRVLVSVEALAKGFDVPDVSCVIDCRPLRKSLSTAIQMWGRGLRTSPETGKNDCILLDHSGNIIRFREDFEAIYHEGLDALDMGEKLDKVVRKDKDEDDEKSCCPQCGYQPFHRRCMSCGYQIQPASLVEHEAGESHEIMIRGKPAASDEKDLWAQCVSYCRGRGNSGTIKQRAAHGFKSITGQWPPWHWSIDVTAPVTKAVANKFRANYISYSKARNAA